MTTHEHQDHLDAMGPSDGAGIENPDWLFVHDQGAYIRLLERRILALKIALGYLESIARFGTGSFEEEKEQINKIMDTLRKKLSQ